MLTYTQLKGMSPDERERAIDTLIADNMHQICDDSAFCDCSAGTNAAGWMTEDYEANDPDFDDANQEVRVPLTYDASGDQIEDKGHCGTRIVGAAVAVIDASGEVSMEEVTAEIDYGD